MKKLFLFFVVVFTNMLDAYSQKWHVDSTRFITGNNPVVDILFAIPTTDKGILFVGDNAFNTGGIIPYFPIDTGSLGNVLIGKIDSEQKISWIKVYGGTHDDIGLSACETPDGGYAILAQTASNDGNITGFKGAQDIWLLRLDAMGNLLWEKTYGSSGSDQAVSIANTPDNGFIILGTTNGTDGDVPFHYGYWEAFDWLVLKTDATGNVQWSRDIGGTGDEHTSGSILAIDTAYYLISNTDSRDHDCNDTLWHKGVLTNNDCHVLKISGTGSILWDSSYGGSLHDGVSQAIYDNRDNTIVFAGYSFSSDYMVTTNNGNSDMWVVKIKTDGTLLWQSSLGGTEQDGATGICQGPANGYLIYGATSAGPVGGQDSWFFVLASDGSKSDGKIFGGSSVDNPYSIVPYLSSYVAVGSSASETFNEGSVHGRNCYGGAGYLSYIDSGTLEINNITTSPDNTIILWPNPANDMIKISYSQNNVGRIAIYNILGQVVLKEKATKSLLEIDISNWTKGMYSVIWTGENGLTEMKKLIVN